jgi:hypothetical protein
MALGRIGLALVALAALPILAGCEDMRALEAQLQQNAAAHPLGPLGPGLDMYVAGEQIRAARGY